MRETPQAIKQREAEERERSRGPYIPRTVVGKLLLLASSWLAFFPVLRGMYIGYKEASPGWTNKLMGIGAGAGNGFISPFASLGYIAIDTVRVLISPFVAVASAIANTVRRVISPFVTLVSQVKSAAVDTIRGYMPKSKSEAA